MKNPILAASVMLLTALTIVSCKRSKPQNFSIVTSNLVSEVKTKTGVRLPDSARFILSTNSPRGNSDIWFFEMDAGNSAQFPQQLELQPRGDGRKAAKVMEGMSGITIGIPEAWYFGIWQTSNAQCHATLITTSNGDYLMLQQRYP
jgi:hypothetical protein